MRAPSKFWAVVVGVNLSTLPQWWANLRGAAGAATAATTWLVAATLVAWTLVHGRQLFYRHRLDRLTYKGER